MLANATEQISQKSSSGLTKDLAQLKQSLLSFMNTIQSRGPGWDRWGTPGDTKNGSEEHPLILTT